MRAAGQRDRIRQLDRESIPVRRQHMIAIFVVLLRFSTVVVALSERLGSALTLVELITIGLRVITPPVMVRTCLELILSFRIIRYLV